MNSLGLLLPEAFTPGTVGALTTALRADGWRVQEIRPQARAMDPTRLLPAHDLYLLLSSSPLALAMAGVLTARGAMVLNPHPAVIRARDPIVRTTVLAAAALPVPPSWTTGQGAALAPLVTAGPLRVEPHPTADGADVAELRDPAAARAYGAIRDRFGLPVPLVATRTMTRAIGRFWLEVVGGVVLPPFIGRPGPAAGLAVAATAALGLLFAGVGFAETAGRLVITGVDPVPLVVGGADLGAALAGLVRRRAGRLAPPTPAYEEVG